MVPVQNQNVVSTNSQPLLNMTKKYFKLLQAIHHQEIALQNDSFPKGMTHMVSKMSTFIKPACPNPETSNKIQQNTKNWVKNNFNILREHYESIISALWPTFTNFDIDSYHRALKWARTRYGRKLTISSN